MTWTDPTTKKEYGYTWGFDHIKPEDIFEKENKQMNDVDKFDTVNNIIGYGTDIKFYAGKTQYAAKVNNIDYTPDGVNVTLAIKNKVEYVPYSKMYNNRDRKSSPAFPSIKKIIFNDPATIIFWSDNTKTVVKCGENDWYDPEKGMAMAIAKKVLGNEGNYYETFKKWMKDCDAECIYPEIPFIIPEFDIGKYFRDKLEDFIGKPEDHLIAGDGNPPKEEAEPAKKPKWKIHWWYVGENETHVYNYAYSTKYSAERAARRMFDYTDSLAVIWYVEQEV